MKRTFKPYEGPEKYIFVSYSHRDGETIAGMLEVLNEKGFRIWYDEGIEWGTEWPESIAKHLYGCAIVMAFHSKTSIASRNCRQEINYALKCGKDILSVYLEEVELSKGMDMRLSSYQSTYPYQYADQEEFYLRLTEEPLLQDCRSSKAIKQIDESSAQMSDISQRLTRDNILSQAGKWGRFDQAGVKQIRKPTVALEPEMVPPHASKAQPELSFVSTTVQKPEDVSISGHEVNSDSQPQTEQAQNPQAMSEVQPASMSDMKIEDDVLVKYDGPGGDVVIPEGVIRIGDSAFSECASLTGVIIPDGVTEIGEWAFDDCESLTSITIPNSVTTIEDCAFSDCASLTSVTIPDSVTAIGESAFDGCTSLDSITIPDGVTEIGNWAFTKCTSLDSITIPDSVTAIGEYAFSGCKSLTSVTIPDGVTTIEDGTFSGCASLTSVTIPDGVTSIGNSAFSGCASLTSVTIPNGVTEIGNWAFTKCTSLTSVIIPKGVITIGEYAFKDCSDELVIHAPALSYAHKYAKKHNIRVQRTNGFPWFI